MARINWRKILIGELSWKRLLRSILFVYASVSLYLFFGADRLIFLPPQPTYQDDASIVKLETIDGDRISATYFPNSSAVYTILYAHGNNEDLGQIASVLQNLNTLGFSVFAYDYRGYGTSEGKPSERNAYRDIDAAYGYLIQDLEIPPDRIIAYGRSVGGGSAIDLASRQPIGGLVVESSFVSAFRVVTRIPLFPFDKFANIDKIDRVNCPVLVMHGTADEIIPFWHGEKLFQVAQIPKQSLWVAEAGHQDLVAIAGERYRQSLQEFRRLLVSIQRSAVSGQIFKDNSPMGNTPNTDSIQPSGSRNL
ncbi:MAG: alpha/beta hydrolase [Cyanobacteriota bacterium]|nr:alpha/beta hydrolase [Cyanobacteriota bacterium]